MISFPRVIPENVTNAIEYDYLLDCKDFDIGYMNVSVQLGQLGQSISRID